MLNPRRCLKICALSLLLALPAVPLAAQFPTAPEIEFPGAQWTTLAAARDGTLALVWTERVGADQIDQDVFGRVYLPDGTPVTEVFRLSEDGERWQGSPAVARTADGGLVAGWFDCTPDPGRLDCGFVAPANFLVRRFAADGTPLGPAQPANVGPALTIFRGRVAVAADDSFLAAWVERGDGWPLFVRKYAADGTPQGGAIQVNTFFEEDQFVEQVTARPGSGWMVVWSSLMHSDLLDVAARFLNADGIPVGPELQLNPTRDQPDSNEDFPQDEGRVAFTQDGGFYAVWGEAFTRPYGRLFDADGTPLTDAQVLDPRETLHIFDSPRPQVVVRNDRAFLVVWLNTTEVEEIEVPNPDIFGRWLAPDGTPRSDIFQINDDTAGNQQAPQLVLLPNGDALVVWKRNPGEDNATPGVFGRRLSFPDTPGTLRRPSL